MIEEKKSEDKDELMALIVRSKQGDSTAYGQLIQRFAPRAYGLAYSFLNNHHDAEDISQEAFIKAFRSLDSFQPTGSFSAWLLKIVANLAKNKLRWRKLRDRLSLFLDASDQNDQEEAMPVQIADPDRKALPADHADAVLRSKFLGDAMGRLPDQQQAALYLKFMQGYKVSEIARIMGLAQGTVKSHIFRGLESMKKILGEEDAVP